jgi:hypothetical protein
MKIGDKIRIIKLPEGLVDDKELQTRSLFSRCLGEVFPIVGIVPIGETGCMLLELEVGEVLGKAAVMDSIWIESDFVELL